ncbi:methyltransferase domain-containing protein [Granulicatella sp. zg-ZJ]|uniref:methyltransferase domain-containing protein n=1 Tax=Granulicatella sp. zg-ZJ TaxID=2678504 RepID=UPI0013D85E45|nr:methyltransferase domain-containing protein [Granulicatella sp. zg-ZJ]NEW62209.1 methyltransferase domain-containing protein [Granulicatella sp. zg-ZJ]
MPIYDCGRCGFIYNSFEGDTKNGVPKHTELHDLKSTLCSMCGMSEKKRYIRPATDYKGLEAQCYYLFSGKSSPLKYEIDELENKYILDVGAGFGRVGVPFLEYGSHVTLLEKSKEMLEKIPQHILDKVTVIQEDILKVDLPKEQYDVIIAADGFLQHFTPKQQCIIVEKLMYSLKKQGQLILEVFIPNDMAISVEKVKEAKQGLYFFYRAKATLHLPTKEIQTDISIQECMDNEVINQYRFIRLLYLILPDDIPCLLERAGITYTSLVKERFDTAGLIQENLINASGIEKKIKKDWIQGGYPFSTSDTNQVNWFRFTIEK